MNNVKYKLPDINPAIINSEIVSWNFQERIFKDHGKYCIRYQLEFSDNRVENRQKGGFKTKKEAIAERNSMIQKLYNHEFSSLPNLTVKEFYDYWLYYYIMIEKQSSYQTFMTYRNVINNYMLPVIGNRKIITINRSDLVRFLAGIPYKSVLKTAEHILRTSFQYGKAKSIIEHNPVLGAIKDNQTRLQMEEKQKNEKITIAPVSKRKQTYSVNQVCRLLAVCKEKKSTVYLPLLITLTTGLRISELIGLKYCDIDTFECKIFILRQIGRKLEFIENSTNVLNQECKTKTDNSIRSVILPSFTLDEIMLDHHRRKINGTLTSQYLFSTKDGNPVHRNYFRKEYKSMVEAAGLPFIRWHDLRHTYATILYNNQINLKAISQSLGHATEYFTKEVYIEPEETLPVVNVLDVLDNLIENSYKIAQENSKYVSYNIDYPWERYLDNDAKNEPKWEDKRSSILSVNKRDYKRKMYNDIYVKEFVPKGIYNFCYPFETYLDQIDRINIPVYDMAFEWNSFIKYGSYRPEEINCMYNWETYLLEVQQNTERNLNPSNPNIYNLDYEWCKLWNNV